MPTQNADEATPVQTSPDVWTGYIKPFADILGKTVEEVTEALKPLVGEPGPEAIDALKSDEFAPFDDIRTAFNAVPLARLRKAVSDHLRRKETEAAQAPQALTGNISLELLPSVPDDESWLATLKVGGELKVNATTVIAGMRAALASRSGLFDLPAELNQRMETHAEALTEPVGKEYFDLRKLLTKRSYGEIFAALGIGGGAFTTQKRKDALVERLNEKLWPALIGFNNQLQTWSNEWQRNLGNPGALMGTLAAVMAGGRGGSALPPGIMQPPATDGLRTAGEAVVTRINEVFAGLGIPVALAMAYDAQNIKTVLNNPGLPAQIGAANRDQMLKMLGVDVDADYVRLERNVTRYALGIMEYAKVPADSEIAYVSALLTIGNQIPWDRLATTPRRAPRRAAGLHDEER